MTGGDGFLKDLPVGIVENALMHTDPEPLFDLKTKFKIVRDPALLDYVDADPPAELLRTDRELSARYAGPIRACVLDGGPMAGIGKGNSRRRNQNRPSK